MKIGCIVTKVELNIEDYGAEFFNTLKGVPKVGELVAVERRDGYPFKVGGRDGFSLMPPDWGKSDNPSPRLYYVWLEQIEIIEQ